MEFNEIMAPERIQEIKDFIQKHNTSKIYLGVDSQRQRKNKVKIASVIIVHYDGCHGAKVFENITYQDIRDGNLSRPYNRMMSEVQVIIDVYNTFEDVLFDKEFEVHLDIAKDKSMGSSVAYGSAFGMIQGLIGVEPIFKPNAWASSTCADKFSK